MFDSIICEDEKESGGTQKRSRAGGWPSIMESKSQFPPLSIGGTEGKVMVTGGNDHIVFIA